MEIEKPNKPTTSKYDRQSRLWGGHGQENLLSSSILLIGGSPGGVETLKNLVLPCIGYIFIMDQHKVTKRDIGNNFFIPSETEGQSRAEVLTEFLLEMNPWHYDPQTKDWDGVKGKGLVKDPSTITREDL